MKRLLFLIFLNIPSFAQDLELVKNIATGTEGIEILRKHFDGENVFFVSKDKSNIQTLWFYDRSLNTFTILQTDEEKQYQYPFGGLTLYKNKVYWAKGSIWARELWVSDGTVNGTQLLNSNIGSFSMGNLDDDLKGNGFGKFMPAKNILYFYSQIQNSYTTSIWRTDGSPSGTYIIDNTYYSGGINNGGSQNDYFYYKKNGNTNGTSGSQDLWVCDGVNTSKVATIHPNSNQGTIEINSSQNFTLIAVDSSKYKKLYSISIQNPYSLNLVIPKNYAPDFNTYYMYPGNYRGNVIFRWSLGNNNTEFWKTDGTTAGTQAITNTIVSENSPNYYGQSERYQFFYGNFDDLYPSTFWVVDKKNNQLHKILRNGNYSISPYQYFVNQGMGYVPKTNMEGKIYFIETGGQNIMEIDTTNFNLTLKFNIPYNVQKYYTDIYSTENKLFITRNENGKSEDEIFVMNGDSLKLITETLVNPKPSQLRVIGATNQRTYFLAYHPEHGKEVWYSNGLPSETLLLTDFNTKPASSNPNSIIPFLDGIFVLADNGKYDQEPWFSKGDSLDTSLKYDIWGITSPLPNALVKWGNHVYTLYSGNFLSKMDTVSWSWVRNSSLSLGPNYKTKFVKLGNSLFYSGYSSFYGIELYYLNSSGGSDIVRDIYNTSSFGSTPRNLIVAGDYIYFNADGNTTGTELYRSDGTYSGTTIVSDISPGYASTNFMNFKAFQNELVFVKDSSQLWKCNITNPTLIQDFGSSARFLDSMIIFNSDLYFGIKNGSNPGLYRLTSGNTIEYVNNSDFSSFKELKAFVLKNALFYSDNQGLKKLENQITNLTVSGLDIKNPTPAFGKVYFNGTLSNESELWSVDSTFLVNKAFDINPGSNSSNPENLTFSTNSLFFSATRDDVGRELFRITDCPSTKNISITNNLNPVKASKYILSIENINDNKSYKSGKSIVLNPGFVTQPLKVFTATIGGCNN